MIPVFPTEREAKRQVLLEAVDEVRDVLAAGADEAEDLATLPKTTVEALYESGLLSLKLPAELGVSDIAYELHGKMALGLPDIDPMS